MEQKSSADGQETHPPADDWLSLAEAATRMNTSCPYAALLCNHGKLGEVLIGSDGQLRVRLSSVVAYLALRDDSTFGPHLTPMAAAQLAGLYDIPEEQFVGFVREKLEPPKAAPVRRAHRRRRP